MLQNILEQENPNMLPHMFFTSAPFEINNSGDFDYTQRINKVLQQIGFSTEHITQKTLSIETGCKLYSLQKLINVNKRLLDAKNNFVDFEKTFYGQFASDKDRKSFINNIKEYICKKSNMLKRKPILNIQMRVPQTGFLFMPDDIKQLKNSEVSVILTCHQYKLFKPKRHLQAIYHYYFKEADLVLFFNEKDMKNASKHANRTKIPFYCQQIFKHRQYDLFPKALLTQVPPTIPYQTQIIDNVLQRAPNIISFGMIRPNKGFEQILEIAKYFAKNKNMFNQNIFNSKGLPRIMLVGYPSSSKLIEEILQIKFGKKVLQSQKIDTILERKGQNSIKQISKQNIDKLRLKINEISQICQEKAPIDLYLDVEPQQMIKIFKSAKYALKYDEKGWANNASSHINALANGLIVFTGWGMCTDDDVLPCRIKNNEIRQQGEFYNAIILPKKKYGSTLHSKLNQQEEVSKFYRQNASYQNKSSVFPQEIIEQIIQRQNNIQLNRKTLEKAKQLLQKKFNPNKIAMQFYLKIIQKLY